MRELWISSIVIENIGIIGWFAGEQRSNHHSIVVPKRYRVYNYRATEFLSARYALRTRNHEQFQSGSGIAQR